MATPVSLRRDEERFRMHQRIAENRRLQTERNIQREYDRLNSLTPTSPRPASEIKRLPAAVYFENSDDYSNFDWDDWVGGPPNTRSKNSSISLSSSGPRALSPIAGSVAHSSLQSCNEIPITKRNVLTFHGGQNYLSTFYNAPFTVFNQVYPSVEFYYELCKIVHFCKNDCYKLMSLKRSADCKRAASVILRQNNIPRKAIDAWKQNKGVYVLYDAIYAKFTQNSRLRKFLMDTKNRLIVHCYPNDNIFASGCSTEELYDWVAENEGRTYKVPLDHLENLTKYPVVVGNGKNLLGYVLMRVRAELRRENESAFANLSIRR